MQQKIYKNIVGGEWLTSEQTLDIYSPIDGALIGQTQAMSQNDIDVVMKHAKDAQPDWYALPMKARADILYKTADLLEERADDIANVMVLEIAKGFNDAKTEIIRTADLLRYTADIGIEQHGDIVYGGSFDRKAENKRAFVERVPLGVVLAIVPFNYPINLAASKIGPAMISGNTVIVKPASQGAMSTLELIKTFIDAGTPAGVINSVTGKGSVIGDYVTAHPAVDFINFTGSTAIGEHIGAISGMKPLLFELGGKDAALVLADADLDHAANEIVGGAYNYSGQRCTAIKRVFVLEAQADALAAKIQNLVAGLSVGMPQDNAAIVPVIDQPTVNGAKALYDDAIEKGATALLPFKAEGTLMHPVLMDHVTADMDLAWVEPFAPILPIIRVTSVEEMIKLSNLSEYGLQSSIFTKDTAYAQEIAAKLEVGTVHINSRTGRGPDNFPFLGVKKSGVGVQGIKYSIESMTRYKSVVMTINK